MTRVAMISVHGSPIAPFGSRETGGMKIAATGVLATTGASTVRSNHNFFGGPSKPSTAP